MALIHAGIRAPDGLTWSHKIPAEPRHHYFSYSPQSNAGACLRLRLAIYENDINAWGRSVAKYDEAYRSGLGPHILQELFAKTVSTCLGATRHIDIRFRLFWIKLERFLVEGRPSAGMPAILARYRAREDQPDHAGFKWELSRVDILAGRPAGARRKIESMRAASSRFLLLGSINFLDGRNDEALMNFRQALKLYKKEAGKRKIFFNGSNGLFFVLALIRADDRALHGEIQTYLDAG